MRLLGGSGYWPYGVERLVETCRANGIPLALLPGDDQPDAELAELSTVPPEASRRLWRYLAEGGPGNADNFLRYAAIADRRDDDANLAQSPRRCCASRALLARPGRCRALPTSRARVADGDGGSCRSSSTGRWCRPANTAPVDALVAALAARRLRPLPVFVHSLKDGEAAALLAEASPRTRPRSILNATGFSVAASGGDDPLRADCPVLQVVFSGGDEDGWRAGTRGLGPRDLAMNVALPEIDGRILTRAVSFKAPLGRDPETEADLVGYRPVADRIAFVAELARNWARLRAKPPAERRVAIVLANYPNRTAASATASGSTRRPRRSAILRGADRGRLSRRPISRKTAPR